jgi:hypothetical protein
VAYKKLPWHAPGSGALFSDCRTWRYSLWRVWQPELRPTAFICLNPSTADETNDDPTVRRCINFAKKWGTGGFFMLNAFAVRSTDPKLLYSFPDPVGPENDRNLIRFAKLCSIVVAAWGVHASKVGDRHSYLLDLFKVNRVPLHCLKVTKGGMPSHPLYLANDSQLNPYP